MWLPKRCRKPKQVGLATADCSALTIHDFTRMAERGDGRLFILTTRSADMARRVIAEYRRWTPEELEDALRQPGAALETRVDGRVVAIGPKAVAALAGTDESIARWEDRRRRQGRVYVRQSRAL
jgi:hypothetical protein